MLCKAVATAVGGRVFPCGQCRHCRINKRRTWKLRLLLEASLLPQNAFITLTYDPGYLPPGGNLHPPHLQAFLKRLRKRVAPQRFRFFAVGEYGDKSWRPHYHAILFGFPSCERRGYLKGNKLCRAGASCLPCSLIRDAWGMGHVVNGIFSDGSASYCSGYIQKKLTRADDPRLDGRPPEFTRMSLRPGIGFSAMERVALELGELAGPDVPSSLFANGRALPLGRYLRSRLRDLKGVEKGGLPGLDLAIYSLRLAASQDDDRPGLRDRVQALYASRSARRRAGGPRPGSRFASFSKL